MIAVDLAFVPRAVFSPPEPQRMRRKLAVVFIQGPGKAEGSMGDAEMAGLGQMVSARGTTADIPLESPVARAFTPCAEEKGIAE